MESLIDPGSARQGVLLIGTGRRARENFLPALNILSDRFALIGAHSRRPENRRQLSRDWSIATFASLDEVPWDAVDVAVVTIPPSSVAEVALRILDQARHVRLVLDTPAPAGRGDSSLRKTLAEFPDVYIAEDFMAFPQFALMRQVARSGAIGDVQSVRLDHWGYEYHGLALVRSFYGLPRVVRATRTRRRMSISMSRGRRGEISLPYDPTRGGVTVAGTQGSLSTDESVSGASLMREPGPTGRPSAFRLEAGGRQFAVELAHTSALCADPRFPADWFNICKTHGLISVLEAAAGRGPAYDLAEATHDALVARFSRRGLYVGPSALLTGHPRL